jgi:hypothetical protein
MKKIILIVLCWLILLFGCATATRPNISVLYQIPELQNQLPLLPAGYKLVAMGPLPSEVQTLFQQLYSLDPGLALEIGKLPEFQDEVGEKQILALSRFTQLISNPIAEGKSNVAELLKVGKPEVRRYCTPLQAIFWLLEKNEYDPNTSLLNRNWPSKIFLLNALLTNGWDFSEKDRWKDYKVVTDRLNAPELVDYYEKRKFIYAFRNDHVGQPYGLFKTDRGQCADVTAFTVDCLNKGGYEAWDHHVESPTGRNYHHVTRFVMDGKHYIMDNGRPDKHGIVPLEEYSPFKRGKVFLK